MKTSTKKTSKLLPIIASTGLNESVQNDLILSFEESFKESLKAVTDSKKIIVYSEEQSELMQQASIERKSLVKKRKLAEAIKKGMKEDTIKYNKAVDMIFNTIHANFKEAESHLQEQEDFKKLLEAKRAEELLQKRIDIIRPYESFIPSGVSIGTLDQAAFDFILDSAKKAKEDFDKAELTVDYSKEDSKDSTSFVSHSYETAGNSIRISDLEKVLHFSNKVEYLLTNLESDEFSTEEGQKIKNTAIKNLQYLVDQLRIKAKENL